MKQNYRSKEELIKDTRSVAAQLRRGNNRIDFGEWGTAMLTNRVKILDEAKGLIVIQLADIWPML